MDIFYFKFSAIPGSDLISVDLRTVHHSLSVRPHAQHGISATRDSVLWKDNNRDLKEYVIATVRFDVAEKWFLSGYMASPKYLFPSSYFDNTLKKLQGTKLLEIISRTERKHNLPDRTLGYVSWVT